MKKIYIIIILLFVTISVSGVSYAGLVKEQVISIDGIERTYDTYVPNKGLSGVRPLVVLLHGHFGDADVMTGENGKKAPYKIWLSIAERERWFLVIPDGAYGPDDHRGWNDCRAESTVNPVTDDVKFINSVIDKMLSVHSIDKNRIYAHGTSNGGNMAYRLAQEAGDKYRAVASIVSQMTDKSKCNPVNLPISVLIMNGTKDPILPYKGGEAGKRHADKDKTEKGKTDKGKRGSVLSTADTVKYWLKNNSINTPPSVSNLPNINKKDRSTVHIKQYTGGKHNTEVVLYEVRGGGHTEPSLSEHYARLYKLIVGRQNKDFEMAEEIWKFFERNR
jgi:polyhydroxybutyrate depolymerase